MAGMSNALDVKGNKLKFELANAGSVQETMYRAVMSFIDNLATGKLKNRQLSNVHPRKGPSKLQSLDLDVIWQLAQLTTRGRGRGRGGTRSGRDGRDGKIADGEYRGGKCFTCGSKGHPSHKCPKANPEAVKEYEEKIKARNNARQLRRLGGDCVVSDDKLSLIHI